MGKSSLELLEFQIENEIHKFGEQNTIKIFYHNYDGKYLEHIVEGGGTLSMINKPKFLPLLKDVDIRISTLGEFSKEVKKLLVIERSLNSIRKNEK